MRALLRADWIRYRRRLDLWIIAVAVLVFSTIGFLNGYHRDATDPEQMTEAEIRDLVTETSFFEGMSPDEIRAQIDQQVSDWLASQEADRQRWEDEQRIRLQQYDIAQAPLTILGVGWAPLIAAFLMATLIVGDEFRHGTIRTSLLAASDRRRFLTARLITLTAIAVCLFALVIVLSLVLSVGLHVVGAEIPPPTVRIDAGSAIALVASELLTVLVVMGFGVALTLILRSGALPLLITLIYAFVELFVAGLPIFAERQPLAGFQQVLLTRSATRLVQDLASASNATTFQQSFGLSGDPATLLPLWTSALIIAAWLGLFLVLADRRIRTMDIVE